MEQNQNGQQEKGASWFKIGFVNSLIQIRLDLTENDFSLVTKFAPAFQ